MTTKHDPITVPVEEMNCNDHVQQCQNVINKFKRLTKTVREPLVFPHWAIEKMRALGMTPVAIESLRQQAEQYSNRYYAIHDSTNIPEPSLQTE